MQISELAPLAQSQATPPNGAPISAASESGSGPAITSDFETFLRMMTVQLRNQDPLDPVDSAEFSMQLATFAGVEQQVYTNQLLGDLNGALAADGLAQMANWVGKEVRAVAPAWFDGQPVTVVPNPAQSAERAEMVVRDATGAEVGRYDVPVSVEPIEWAGLGPDGDPMPAGAYSFEVVSYAGDEVVSTDPAEIYDLVREVRSEGDGMILLLQSGTLIPVDAASGLREPG